MGCRTTVLSILLPPVLAGCPQPSAPPDTELFQSAVVEDLKRGSMGMAIHEFKELVVDGEPAAATISLYAADTQVKVRRRFEFKRDGDA